MKILRCGCGYEATSLMFDYRYHNNNGCGNSYIETIRCDKIYILVGGEPDKTQWEQIHADASQFDEFGMGIMGCEIIRKSFEELVETDFSKLKKISQFIEIFFVNETSVKQRFELFEIGGNNITINEWDEQRWLPTLTI